MSNNQNILHIRMMLSYQHSGMHFQDFFKGKQFIEKNPYISSILQPQSGQRTSFKSTLLLKVSKNRNGLSEVSLHLHQKRTKIFLYFCPEKKSILGKIVCDTCDLFISKFCPTQLSQHT